jgi:uncharacterized protein (DUF433 family)
MPEFPEASYNIDDEVIDIVSTPSTLGGAPRLDGHRIAVYHIVAFYHNGHSIADITGDDVYPHLSQPQVKGALHYAIDYPEAVKRSSKPRDTPLHMDVSFDSKQGGPRLSVFDRAANEPGPIAQVTLGIDDLPNGYSVQDLHAAWAWMHEAGDRPVSSNTSDGLEEVKQRLRRLLDPSRDRDDLSPEMEAKLQGVRNALAVIDGEDVGERPESELETASSGREPLPPQSESDVNEQVEAEWVEETTPFERVRSVLCHTYDPQSASEIADRARTSENTARKHARHLVGEGFAVETADPEAKGTLYKRSEESLVMEQVNRIRKEVDDATLTARVSEMQGELRAYRKEYGAESPEDAVLSDADIDSEELQVWRTTRRNLNFAKIALAISNAEKYLIEEDTAYE